MQQLYDKTTKTLYSCQVIPASSKNSSYLTVKSVPVLASAPAAAAAAAAAPPKAPKAAAASAVAGPSAAPKRKRVDSYVRIRDYNVSILDKIGPNDSAAPETSVPEIPNCSFPYAPKAGIKLRPIMFETYRHMGEPTNTIGQPGRGPYRVVINDDSVAKLFGINKGHNIKIDKCVPRYVLLDPRQWAPEAIVPNTSPLNPFNLAAVLGSSFSLSTQDYRFTQDVEDRDGNKFSNVLTLAPNFNTMGKIIPAVTVFTCNVSGRKYTINVLRRIGGAEERTDERYLSLRFGTQTVNEKPFEAYSRASDCMEIRFDRYTKSCDIKYLQIRPVFFLQDYYDVNGKLVIEKKELYNKFDNWRHCAQPVDAGRTGCTTDQALLRANNAKSEVELSNLREDFKISTWLEIARQFSLYIGLTTYISLDDHARTTWPSTGPESKPDDLFFSYLIFAHYLIGRKGKTLYESHIPNLKPTNDAEVHAWIVGQVKKTVFYHVKNEYKATFLHLYQTIYKRGSEYDFQEVLLTDTSDGQPGIVTMFSNMVVSHGKLVLEYIMKNHPEIISKMNESFDIEMHGNIDYYICSYFLWYGLILSGLSGPYPAVMDKNGVALSSDKVQKKVQSYDPYQQNYYFNTLQSKISNVHWIDWAPCW
jgi:hypothetical protein